MAYKVTVFNTYKNTPDLKLQFDTNSALLHDASRDADAEVIYERVRLGLDPFEKPVRTKTTYSPVGAVQ